MFSIVQNVVLFEQLKSINEKPDSVVNPVLVVPVGSEQATITNTI
jgi:hypothetical protein